MKTAIDFLVEWTENINWKKYLLNIILQNKVIDIEIITDEVIDIIANKKEINLITSPAQESKQTQLYIQEIKNPMNINALCYETGCELGKNLNVFYGENGSGKSSYVKIFRKLADNYYTIEKDLNVLTNVYNTERTQNKQTINVRYLIDGTESGMQCVDINIRHADLSRINVFDSGSVTPLLNSDLTFSVLPQGLSYFLKLTELLDLVKVRIQDMITINQTEQKKIFTDSSLSLISEDIISITTNVSQFKNILNFLEIKYSLPENVDTQVGDLEKKIIDLQTTNPVNLIKILGTQKNKLESIKTSIIQLSGKVSYNNINTINAYVKQYDGLLKLEKKHNEEFGKIIQHIVNVNSEWFIFINSAKNYYKSIGLELPVEKSSCIFCGQVLKMQEISLIESCFKHINSETIQSKRDVEKIIESYLLPDVPLTFSQEDEQLFYEDKKVFVEKLKAIINLVEKNKKIFKESIESKRQIPGECIIDFDDIIQEINIQIKDIESRLVVLGRTNGEVADFIGKLDVKKNDLLKRKKIYESIDLFRKLYEYRTKIDYLTKMKSKFNTTSLSVKSKEAFKEIVAEDYTDSFNSYCDYLGVPKVNISLSSQKGQSRRGKYVVSEDIKLTEIMSEGEQKAIALAEFATDLKIRKNYCTTLFDDPVTSFDYKRAEKIANMIYEMSQDRQIILYTHNIMFYYYLYNCCYEDKNVENKFFKIDEFDRDNKGLISLSAEGRLENLKGITNKIKDASQKINSKECLGDVLERTLRATYSDIRTWCELIVEEGFLKRVIRRYEPDIKFTLIPKISGEFVNYLPAVSDLFNKSCRYMLGHSQPTETQNTKPSREEFNTDLAFILELFEKYKN